ncbi:hypothetical protein [Flocculibacter collagenilyticus]|uniref:hypothetical protein n=1 Tax=Flocculibacter collagenilyticus TaxID=2744479 RepID=UPI0018F68140|nr:hypothetical protein [Flocculibacter collagenilyticus]
MPKRNRAWIQSLYERSWEMELLISGFVLVFLLQSFNSFNYLSSWTRYHIADNGSIATFLSMFVVALFVMSCFILTAFLVMNLAFRAYWVALIGLMSSIDKSHGSVSFSRYRKQNIQQVVHFRQASQHINTVDHIGSQLFSIALVFVFYIFSATALFLWVSLFNAALASLTENSIVNMITSWLEWLYFVAMIWFLFDIYSGGAISRGCHSRLQPINYYIYRVFRMLSGYFLYEKVALSGRQAGLTKAINITLLVCLVGSVFRGAQDERGEYFAFTNWASSKAGVHGLKINYLSDYVKKGYLNDIMLDKRVYRKLPVKVFVPLTATLLHHLDQACDMTDSNEKNIACFSQFIQVSVDGELQSLTWHPETNTKYATKGLSAYIDLPSLARGEHQLMFRVPYLDQPLTAPFWFYP